MQTDETPAADPAELLLAMRAELDELRCEVKELRRQIFVQSIDEDDFAHGRTGELTLGQVVSLATLGAPVFERRNRIAELRRQTDEDNRRASERDSQRNNAQQAAEREAEEQRQRDELEHQLPHNLRGQYRDARPDDGDMFQRMTAEQLAAWNTPRRAAFYRDKYAALARLGHVVIR